MKIELWASEGVGVIVGCETRVVYSNQAGGYACRHPEMEGVYVPLNIDKEPLETRFDDGYAGWCSDGITENDADFLDDYLPPGIRTDRARLKDSMEAWIYVRFTSTESDGGWSIAPTDGFMDELAVLTWPNSD